MDAKTRFEELLLRCTALLEQPPIIERPAVIRFLAASWANGRCPRSVEDFVVAGDDRPLPDALRRLTTALDKRAKNGYPKSPAAVATRRANFRHLLERIMAEADMGPLPNDWDQAEWFGINSCPREVTADPAWIPRLHGDWNYICTTQGPPEKYDEKHGGFFTIDQPVRSRRWTLEGNRTWKGQRQFLEDAYQSWDTVWGRVFEGGKRCVIRYAYKIRDGILNVEGYGESDEICTDAAGGVIKVTGKFFHHPGADARFGRFIFERRLTGDSPYWGQKYLHSLAPLFRDEK